VSEENLEIARRAIEATIRKPKADFDTMNVLFHPEHEYVSRIEEIEGGSRRGGLGYREWLENAADIFEWNASLEQVREIDEERVLAITPTRITGEHSGVEISERFVCLMTVRDGRIVRTVVYPSEKEALEAAGLSE
jgi:ketosteroid isomerase-like protein